MRWVHDGAGADGDAHWCLVQHWTRGRLSSPRTRRTARSRHLPRVTGLAWSRHCRRQQGSAHGTQAARAHTATLEDHMSATTTSTHAGDAHTLVGPDPSGACAGDGGVHVPAHVGRERSGVGVGAGKRAAPQRERARIGGIGGEQRGAGRRRVGGRRRSHRRCAGWPRRGRREMGVDRCEPRATPPPEGVVPPRHRPAVPCPGPGACPSHVTGRICHRAGPVFACAADARRRPQHPPACGPVSRSCGVAVSGSSRRLPSLTDGAWGSACPSLRLMPVT